MTWLLPALIAAAQLAWWPGVPLLRGHGVPVGPGCGVVALTVVVSVALGFRRRTPVVVAIVAAVAVNLGTWLVPSQVFIVPGDAVLVLAVTDLIALFSVAVRSSRRTTGLTLAAMIVWQATLTLDSPVDILLNSLEYVFVAAAGRLRRRWVADRLAAARRLDEASRARREAAAAERRRQARELHDVTAHHLTSIVVNASAAQFVGGPQTEALDFAARTGRETLDALRRLVDVLPDGSPAASPSRTLADLADDFRQLGQSIALEITGSAPEPIGEAAFAIAREALTNTLRYAPGTTVRLLFRYGGEGALLVIEDDGGVSAPASGLGGGRGLDGMRDRAAALGGTLTAGPSGTGWRVRATFPPAGGPAPRLRRWLRSEAVVDAGVVLLTLVMPLAGVATLADDGHPVTWTLVAALGHSAPLFWRRRHPWWVVAAVLGTAWLGPLLLATGHAPEGGWPFLFGGGAELAAVYAVASRRRSLGWLAGLIAVASSALLLAVMLVLEPPDMPRTPSGNGLLFAFGAVCAGLLLVPPFAGTWLAGFLAGKRRRERLDREEQSVNMAMADAEWQARGERARVAAGLHTAVLAHAARVPEAAERQDLPGVIDAAKQSLTAMRGLLDGLGRGPGSDPRAVPTLPRGATASGTHSAGD